MKDLMLDLETWGKRYGNAIRSIGAVVFDHYGTGLGREFYVNVEDQSCLDAGLTHNPDTEAWWGRQSAEAQSVFAEDPRHVREASERFRSYFREVSAVRVWCQGANFDEPIIVGVFDVLKIKGTMGVLELQVHAHHLRRGGTELQRAEARRHASSRAARRDPSGPLRAEIIQHAWKERQVGERP